MSNSLASNTKLLLPNIPSSVYLDLPMIPMASATTKGSGGYSGVGIKKRYNSHLRAASESHSIGQKSVGGLTTSKAPIHDKYPGLTLEKVFPANQSQSAL